MKKRIIPGIVSLICAASVLFTITLPVWAAEADHDDTVVVFTSDVHHTSSRDITAANRLKLLLEYVTTAYGTVDALGVSGDLGRPSVGETKYWTYVQRVMDNVASLGIDGVYTTGNHEYKNGQFSTTTIETAKNYTRLGVGKTTDRYDIYCLGAASATMEFPESDIAALSEYLQSVGTEKPVFILSHYPLHAFTYEESGSMVTRDAVNREKVIDLLNRYPNTFFIWGHNHSKNDPHYDVIHDEWIDDREIYFTYAAAGAITDPAENIYAGNITGKVLVALVSAEDKSVSLRYLDEDCGAFSRWSSETLLKFAVIFGENGVEAAVRITAEISEPTETEFFVVCFDAKGKMLGFFAAAKTVDENTTMVVLHFPEALNRNDVAAMKVLALDAGGFCPLGPTLICDM